MRRSGLVGRGRLTLVILSVVGVISATAIVGSARASQSVDSAGQVSCNGYSVPVSLFAAGARTATVYGELCATPNERIGDGQTVQLLIHGGSYDHRYWDFGTVDGVEYSYARHLAKAGFPTFAIDKLGVGRSSRPISALVTMGTQAFVAHQIVQMLRGAAGAPSVPGVPHFGRVIEVGHSLGSLTTWREVIDYQDVDGVLITGMIHHFSMKATVALTTTFYPAMLDPKFALTFLDPGWVTTTPGSRGRTFYNVADANPNVISLDEARKDMFSLGEADGFIPIFTSQTQRIDVPVLVIVGSQDLLCGPDVLGAPYDCSSGAAIAAQEAPKYGPRADVQACTVTPSGHDLELQYDAAKAETAAAAWSWSMIGQNGRVTQSRLPADCGFAG